MTSIRIALLAALPWVLLPIGMVLRMRRSRTLDEFTAEPPRDAPLVSVIVPARNEARNIGRCVRSILSTDYPNVELIVVDDQSTDGTGAIAAGLGATVIETPPLPADWFGKQWACWTGKSRARGQILCFTDADTEHAPDLIPRTINAMRALEADLFTVSGRQEMVTLWEKLVQAQVFGMLNAWYGGTEEINRSKHAWRKIANGQYLVIPRAVYGETGGHEAVKHTVAEDLLLAQRFHRLGRKVVFIEGREQLSTRMYSSLREMIAGWGKNVYAGGMHAMPPRVPRWIFPLGLVFPPLFNLLPPVTLGLAALGFASYPVLVWAAVATAATVLLWMKFYRDAGESVFLALLYPLGAAMALFIYVRAIARGRNVSWKERDYVAS
ncbi:MAG: glycosyltransferase [Gemmatimonadaceae bacterium]